MLRNCLLEGVMEYLHNVLFFIILYSIGNV